MGLSLAPPSVESQPSGRDATLVPLLELGTTNVAAPDTRTVETWLASRFQNTAASMHLRRAFQPP